MKFVTEKEVRPTTINQQGIGSGICTFVNKTPSNKFLIYRKKVSLTFSS